MTEAEIQQIQDEKNGQKENLKYLEFALKFITKANEEKEKEIEQCD